MLHLLSLKQILEPLAGASRVTQATVCHLDQVLLTFGYFIMQYQELLKDSADVLVLTLSLPVLRRDGKQLTKSSSLLQYSLISFLSEQ